MEEKALILKNVRSEGPGTIADYLSEARIPYGTVELGEGEAPPPLDGYGYLIVMGGPMGVYEMENFPHLAIGSRLIREAINRGMRVLGVCLGAQLIAYCLGAKVYKGPQAEIGWRHIELTAEGVKDPLMRKLAMHPGVGDFWRKFKVFQWHEDTFEIPAGAVRLAGSPLYENQAFRYGENVYAFQFHIEVTEKMVREWFKDMPGMKDEVKAIESHYGEYRGRAWNFYQLFFDRAKKSEVGGNAAYIKPTTNSRFRS